MDTVVIYPGRFHPFHKGHKSVYDTLVKRFGKDRVYIATSDKVDPPKSPFTFGEKRAMMALTGVDPSRVVQVKNPYQATEITDNFDPQNTIALFAVSDKDMAEDPRFSFKPRKDGQPSYYQPASKDMQGFDKHAYIITVPTLQFNVLGKPMRSASEFRANFASADDETQKAMITDLFGRYDPNTHKTMAQKIVEQLQRADEILDKLIELGADDCYILEACIRVEALVESINMTQRKQTLYQAIMEGGHTLPEHEIVREANYSKWDHPESADYSQFLEKTFGQPDEATDEQTVWHGIDGFKRVVVRDEYILHGSPAPHYDFVYSYIDLEVPEELSDELAKCSGSILIDHLKNEVGARCGSLTANAVTLNFVMDVVHGRTKPEKEEYEKRILSMKDMFGRGMKFSLEWWPDEAGDADPDNPYYAESIREHFTPANEEITDFNKQDPMNSVIAIRGIGTMSISSALEKVSEMALDIAKLGAMKDAKNVQDNLPRYMDLLATYNQSIQEAYRELASQRKRGGTASRGIDKDIQESDKDLVRIPKDTSDRLSVMEPSASLADTEKAFIELLRYQQLVKGLKATRKNEEKELGEATKDLSLDDVDPKLRPVLQQAITKYPFAKNALDAALHMMMDQMKSDFKQDMEINRLDKENDTQDQEIDDLERKVTKEHCGDPMAPDHKQGRILLMKLYKKEMQCVPGSPEHFEVVKMIDGCRKNIGLDEGMMGDIATAISKPVKAVVDKTVKDYKNRKRLFGKGKIT
jgi:cytidyltransferase-like protein